MSSAILLAPPAPDVLSFFKLLADETRLAIVRLLALTDLRVGELVERVQAPQNAVSYHLKQLRLLGLLRDRPSRADGRDVYYSLDWERLQALYALAGLTLHPGIPAAVGRATPPTERTQRLRILVLCTHNSARSQLAEGLLRTLGGDQVEVASAGNTPAPALHPQAAALLTQWGIDLARHYPKSLDLFRGQHFDYIVTVCDRMREQCPVFPDEPLSIHWSLPDPASIEDPVQRAQAFEAVRRELVTRIHYLLSLSGPVLLQPSRAATTRDEHAAQDSGA